MAIVRINAESEDDARRAWPIGSARRPTSSGSSLLGLEGLVNRRFGEPVYFHPDEFAAALGLDRPALDPGDQSARRRAADRLHPAVPRQRRSASIDRDRKAARPRDRLRGAREAEAARVRQARPDDPVRPAAPLPAVATSSATSASGRRLGPLRPLRQLRRPTDGRPAPRPPRPIDTPAGREVIQKVLSGVARAKGRFGKTTVAQMLAGSDSEKMARGASTS